MNTFIDQLNQWGGYFYHLARPMLWQSSLLIILLAGLDYVFRRQLRASLRYALWLVVLVKLCVPPTFALPTSPVWWFHKTSTVIIQAPARDFSVTYDQEPPVAIPSTLPLAPAPAPTLTVSAWLLLIAASVSVALLVWLVLRWAQITRRVHHAATSERLGALTRATEAQIGLHFPVQTKLTTDSMSPAVCGLFRPAILIPQSLAENFSDEQLRAVLLHELIHLRRRDVWVNFAQALLQIVYWWHPMVWFANARLRRVREEAVDDAVMLALRDEADAYAPTLLAVAQLALRRPLVSLGLVGIMESRHALRQRIERLLDNRSPRRTGLTLASLLGILAFTAVAVPMGDAPVKHDDAAPVAANPHQAVVITAEFYAAPLSRIGPTVIGQNVFVDLGKRQLTCLLMPNDLAAFKKQKGFAGLPPFLRPRVLTRDGMAANLSTGDGTNDLKFTCCPRVVDQGVELSFRAEINLKKGEADPIFTDTVLCGTNLITADSHLLMMPCSGVTADNKRLVLIIGASVITNAPIIHTIHEYHATAAPNQPTVSPAQAAKDQQVRTALARKPTLPQLHIKARFIEAPAGTLDDLNTAATNFSVAAGMTGILTKDNFRTVLRELEQQKGSEELGEPEVTVVAGRQTQMRATTIITVITNLALQSSNGLIRPATSAVETGPILDASALVLDDGYTIDLRTIASLTEFLGYDTPTNGAAGEYIKQTDSHLPVILPRFSVREASGDFKLWDGQTVVLWKLPKHRPDSVKNIDWALTKSLGGPERVKAEKDVVVFITVTIVDPAGNRVHSAQDLPFAQSTVPQQ